MQFRNTAEMLSKNVIIMCRYILPLPAQHCKRDYLCQGQGQGQGLTSLDFHSTTLMWHTTRAWRTDERTDGLRHCGEAHTLHSLCSRVENKTAFAKKRNLWYARKGFYLRTPNVASRYERSSL